MNIRNITEIASDAYIPQLALMFYKNELRNRYYIESLDVDENGMPVNAHPLSVQEMDNFVQTLTVSAHFKNSFLISEGLLPANVLHLNAMDGFVIWYTLESTVQLYFKESLSINNGTASVPALVWKAYKDELYIYALKENGKPDLQTTLYYAPFFNINQNGKVCMGTVDIDEAPKSLEQFIMDWQNYFFNSYFSHLLGGYNPVNGNIVQLWQKLSGSGYPFPKKELKVNNLTIQDLIDEY